VPEPRCRCLCGAGETGMTAHLRDRHDGASARSACPCPAASAGTSSHSRSCSPNRPCPRGAVPGGPPARSPQTA